MKNSLKFLIITLVIRIKQLTNVLMEVLFSRISYYPKSVRNFENDFACFVQTKRGIMFSNATSAIEAALFAVGVGKKSIVGSSAFVIPSSYCAAYNLGAKVEFIDIDENTLNLNCELLLKQKKPTISVLIVVHFYGNPCNMPKIMQWATKHNILVIEDCSHAHGASIDRKMLGSWGDIGIFSLQGAKTVAAGEGGIAVTNNLEFYTKMAAYGHQEGYKKFNIDKSISNIPHFGYGRKMRVHPLGAVLANIDFRYLNVKNEIFHYWFEKIKDLSISNDLFKVQEVMDNAKIGGYAQGICLITKNTNTANALVKKLKNHKVSNFRRDYIESINYFSNDANIPNTIELFDRVIFVPFYQFISFKRWNRFVAVIKGFNG
jgi:dTDP-4-amino-4,6-dideoxygalactose transaminase